jgi:hypothetical protein
MSPLLRGLASALICCCSPRSTLAKSWPLLFFLLLYFAADAPRGGVVGSRGASPSFFPRLPLPGPLAPPPGAAYVAQHGCAAGPYHAPVGHDAFAFPEVPIGAPAPDARPFPPEWRDDAALFLGERGRSLGGDARRRFVAHRDGRPDTHLFDQDLILQFLTLYGELLGVQRPGRATAPWHTGERKDRRHTFPFITGDGFRALADFWCDNEAECRVLPLIMANASHPVWARLRPSQSVIVFATCHDVHLLLDAAVPLLDVGNHTVVLVVHNGDEALEATHNHYLAHPKLAAYFTQNCALGLAHPKVVCVPIGLEPRQFSMHGWRPETLMGSMLSAAGGESPLENLARRRFAFAAWSVGTFKRERGPLLEQLEVGGAFHATHVEDEPPPPPSDTRVVPSNAPPGPYSFVTIGGGGQLEHYHRHILRHSVVLAPRGNGLDTLRAWEALYLGRVVITKNSTMDAVFADLPVLIVRRWEDLTQDMVVRAVRDFSSEEGRAKLSTVKLFMFYWACELGRAAGRAAEFCTLDALRATLGKENWT